MSRDRGDQTAQPKNASQCLAKDWKQINEDSGLLVHNTVSLDEWVPTFRTNLLTPKELTS